MCVCVRACIRTCVRVYVCVCMSVCVCSGVGTTGAPAAGTPVKFAAGWLGCMCNWY